MSNSSYSLFIFDFDGTLSDSRLNIAHSLNAALLACGYGKVEEEHVFPLIGKITLEETFRHFYPEITDEILSKLISEYRKYQAAHIKEEIFLYPSVESTLRQLKSKGKTLCILTTKGTEAITNIVRVLGLAHLFDIIYGRGSGFGDKPEGKSVTYIMTHLSRSFTKSETVVVGDTNIDVETSKNAGVDMIGVAYGTDGAEKLRSEGAKYILNSFDELLHFA